MHALGEYGLMHVKLYEDIARFGHIAHLLRLSGEGERALCDGPVADAEIRQSKMDDCPALQLFGAGRENASTRSRRTPRSSSLDFEDHPFTRYRFDAPCALCGADDSYLDEIVTDDQGARHVRLFRHRLLRDRQAQGHRGTESAAPHKERAHG